MRVLVVDDEPDILLLSEIVLRPAGWEVLRAASGEEALELVSRAAPDVMVLDLRMPGLDGWEVLERLAAAGHSALPVVLFSAHANGGATEREALARGCRSFLRKPFSPGELLSAVERAVSAQ